ncbi:hypothetical protein Tco_1040375 [Tanacetum coccineum]
MYTSHHLDRFTSGSSSSHSSSDHSSSGHSISGHSLPGHSPPDTTVANSSTPLRFVHPPLARTPRCSEAYLHWRSAPLSTMYPPMTSESSAGDSSSESSAGPSRKRCRSLVAIVTSYIHDTRAFIPYSSITFHHLARVKDSIHHKDSLRRTLIQKCWQKLRLMLQLDEMGILDGMLMPDAVERLEQVKEGLQDIYKHVIEIPLQRIEDIEKGQRELEARSLIDGKERWLT